MKIKRIIIGASVLGLIAIFNTDFAEFVGLSILCTFGASLLIWGPIAWVIGAVITAILWPSGNTSGASSFSLSQQRKDAYMAFCEEAKEKGLGEDDIKKMLLEAGWTEEEIKAVAYKPGATPYRY